LLQEAAFFDSNEVGYLLSRLNNDVNKIGMVISFHVNVVLRQFAQFLFGSVYLIKISPSLSLYSFAGIGLVAIVSAVYGSFSRELAEKVQNTFADATAVAETSLSMSETVRGFDGVSVESQKYEWSQSQALQLEEVQAWAYGSHKFISDTLQSALQVLLLFACWTVGRNGGLPTSQLTTFMFYTNFVLESSNEVGDQWAKIMSAVGASTNVFGLVRRIPKVRDPVKPKTLELTARTDNDAIITMKNMTVTYGAMDVPALNEINLSIYRGDKIALVGRSGSGKSSMLRAILRFYDPSSGSCNLNGKSVKEMTRKEIAQTVAIVEQEPHLFPMSLIENVLYGVEKDAVDPLTGEPCYSEKYREMVTKSLRKAGLAIEENNDLNLELDTRVGEGGRALSGGQRQRVTIARALIRKPQVLLLDEPTAALDSESEGKVVKALKKAMEETSCMAMVTHRLGVVRSLGVNRVVILERGKIVESGHPEVLLRDKTSRYARMALEQGITAQSPELHSPSYSQVDTD
jgi:ABC-type multidrug transport system fused ATPase/permease subunit